MPARPGAATVPFKPSTPWQVSQRLCWKIAFPRTASALRGTGFNALGASTAVAALPDATAAAGPD